MQLNSTQLNVELLTRSQREQLSPIGSERRDPGEGVYSDAVLNVMTQVRVSIVTQFNSTRCQVESHRYKWAFRQSKPHLTLHCRVLPPGEFNGKIPESLPVYRESIIMTTVTASP